MSITAHHKLGTSYDIPIKIYNTATDTGESLAGATALSATATHAESGSGVNFVSVTIGAEVGVLNLTRTAGTFTEKGEYSVEVTYTDANAKIQKFPRQFPLTLVIT